MTSVTPDGPAPRDSNLFKPLKIGDVQVKHRIVMPALSRMRATQDHVPSKMMLQYYVQRAAVPGTLIITEANLISQEHSGYTHAPGIWSAEQVAGWREIVDAVHAKGSSIFAQLMGMGRVADPNEAEREKFSIIGASAIPFMEGATVPREMTGQDIRRAATQFGQAARNAIEAGFDGVELLAANGMLVEQFISSTSNQRTDEYGGSVEIRSRFAIEVLQAMVDAVGSSRVAVRFSPFSHFLGMGMEDPVSQYTDLIRKVAEMKLAYLHLIESRIKGSDDVVSTEKLNFAYELWTHAPVVVAGGYDGGMARRLVDEGYPDHEVAVSFGRDFIANPDLVYRLMHALPINDYDRSTFYSLMQEKGYLDYPYSQEYMDSLV